MPTITALYTTSVLVLDVINRNPLHLTIYYNYHACNLLCKYVYVYVVEAAGTYYHQSFGACVYTVKPLIIIIIRIRRIVTEGIIE